MVDALHDPTLELAHWVPDHAGYVDAAGEHFELPAEGSPRVATLIERGGNPLAAIVHDRALLDDPRLMRSVSATAGLLLENERLQAELARARERVSGGTPRAGVYEATIANGATQPVMLPMPEGGGEEAGAAPDADRVYDIAVPRNAPSRGAANAPVTIQLFSDFQFGESFSGLADREFGRAQEVTVSGVELAGRLNSQPFTGGPPSFSTKSPLAKSAWSRIIHEGSRCRGPRESRRFSPSRSAAPGASFDDCRYAALVTMSR